MRPALTGLFVYAILNFLWGVFAGTPPHHASGGSVDARTVRLFSGHWMMFYGAGFAILFSAYRKPGLLAPARCPAGHDVDASARFCPTCGAAVTPTASVRLR